MNKPIYGITLFFILGIILGRYLALPFLPLYLGLTVLFVLTFVLYLKKKEKWTGYTLFLLTLFIGIVYFYYSYYPHSSNHIAGSPRAIGVKALKPYSVLVLSPIFD